MLRSVSRSTRLLGSITPCASLFNQSFNQIVAHPTINQSIISRSVSYWPHKGEIESIEDVLIDGSINWYPGHMHKTMKVLDERVKKSDVIIEVRDARLPFSSINPHLQAAINASIHPSAQAHKKRIVIYNKTDLCTLPTEKIMKDFHEEMGEVCLFTNSKDPRNVKKMLPLIEEMCTRKFSTIPLIVLIIGYPNVGKSSIIGALRDFSMGKSGPKTAPLPGVTRQVSGFLVREKPPVFVYDSPGIMQPSFEATLEGQEKALKLGLVNCFKDAIIGNETLVRYLLLSINQRYKRSYPKFSPLATLKLTNDIDQVLSWVSMRISGQGDISFMSKESRHRRDRAAAFLIHKFRAGAFGRWQFDDLYSEIDERRKELEDAAARLRLKKEEKEFQKHSERGRPIKLTTSSNTDSDNTESHQSMT